MKSAFWNILFGLLFATLVLKGSWVLTSGGTSVPVVSMFDLMLITLATFRMVRLVSYDVITKFIRDAVSGASEDTFLGTISKLLNCPWCTGLWFAFFVTFAYLVTPLAFPIIIILAVAGVASFFQILSNMVGWHAEAKKREVVASSESSCG